PPPRTSVIYENKEITRQPSMLSNKTKNLVDQEISPFRIVERSIIKEQNGRRKIGFFPTSN
ncbi:MAG TPA: hypothetical protein VG897_01425, partial [Terriglobales bacterium]|nr:hypothetical protein [Terriglobales bacterium]